MKDPIQVMFLLEFFAPCTLFFHPQSPCSVLKGRGNETKKRRVGGKSLLKILSSYLQNSS